MSELENRLQVVSNARKLVFALHKGPVVSFPRNAEVNGYGQNNDRPVIVVKNGTDGTWQGADATGFVVVNGVPSDIAERALRKLEPSALDAIYGVHPNTRVMRALGWLEKNGSVDQYTTNADFYRTKLSPAGRMSGKSGIMKRDDRDICTAFYDQKGVLRIEIPGEGIRDITLEILQETYRNADGSAINPGTIPTVEIPETELLDR